jgi:hypothetical protein
LHLLVEEGDAACNLQRSDVHSLHTPAGRLPLLNKVAERAPMAILGHLKELDPLAHGGPPIPSDCEHEAGVMRMRAEERDVRAHVRAGSAESWP